MTYKHTERACFIGYIVQAVVNNFVPLLFLIFQNQFGIPLSQVTVLITLNFLLQLAVDGASVFFIDRIVRGLDSRTKIQGSSATS